MAQAIDHDANDRLYGDESKGDVMEMTDDIDCSEEPYEMELITLINDNAPDIRFNGELVAKRHEQLGQFQQQLQGSVGRWMELDLYRTAGGKFRLPVDRRNAVGWREGPLQGGRVRNRGRRDRVLRARLAGEGLVKRRASMMLLKSTDQP